MAIGYEPLTATELSKALGTLPAWSGDENGLKRHLVFEDFRGAMKFMQACVEGIEALDHHPVWTNKYNSIDVHLDTFDIGHKVTQLDVDLARHLDRVLDRFGAELGYRPDE